MINHYVGCPHKCIYCYADYMRRFTGHGEKWGDFLDVKRFGTKINAAKLKGKKVVLCSVTDAYNPFEKKYRVTRELLAQFVHTEVEVEILTKSGLVLRDLDLIRRIPRIRIGFSLNTLDVTVRKELEPGAPPVARRLEAVKALHGEGINTYLFLSPMFPGITDFREILGAHKKHTSMFYFENLNLRGAFRPVVMRYIQRRRPGLVELYDEIYKRKNTEYWRIVERDIAAFCKKEGIIYGSYFYHEKIRKPVGG